MKRVIFAILLSAICCGHALAQFSDKASDTWAKATAALKINACEEALKLFTQFLIDEADGLNRNQELKGKVLSQIEILKHCVAENRTQRLIGQGIKPQEVEASNPRTGDYLQQK